jgi:hypothetical protein
MNRIFKTAIIIITFSLSSGAVNSEPLYFDYVAHVDSSDRAGAPTGSLLTGQFSYDPDAITRQVGPSHFYPEVGSAKMIARGSDGFFLSLDSRAINVTAGSVNDTMTIQSFVSESANDWHMTIDFIEAGGASGWLQGNNELPTEFPETLNAPFLSIYFTDDFDWVRTIDATIISVTSSMAVPLPSAGYLFGSGLIGLIGLARRTVRV